MGNARSDVVKPKNRLLDTELKRGHILKIWLKGGIEVCV